MKTILTLCLFLLSACSILGRGEQPTDYVIAGLHWYPIPSNFRYERTEWNKVDGIQRLANLCAPIEERETWDKAACAIRINEGGQCVIFSLYSMEQAALIRTPGGDLLKTHEERHCGRHMPFAGRWMHRE